MPRFLFSSFIFMCFVVISDTSFGSEKEPILGMTIEEVYQNFEVDMDQVGAYSGDRIMRVRKDGFFYEIVFGPDYNRNRLTNIHRKYPVEKDAEVREQYKQMQQMMKDRTIINLE